MASDDDTSLSDRISALRSKVQRREQKVRADRQAKARRLEREEPASVGETAALKARKLKAEASAAADEASALASDTTSYAGTTVGVSGDDADDALDAGAAAASKVSDAVSKLDAGGDGAASKDLSDPIMDSGDSMDTDMSTDPLGGDGGGDLSDTDIDF